MSEPFPDWRPPKEIWNRKTFAITISPTERVVVRLEYWQKLLVEFAISAWIDTDADSSVQIARVDSCHDEVHIHRFRADGEEGRYVEFRKPLSISDIQAGYEWGLDHLRTDWDKHVEHWKGGG